MELIERYIHEVGRSLPKRNRDDIQQEIRSLIEDTLDSQAAKTGHPVDDEMVIATLYEFGPPKEMAASYHTPMQYLIGPGWFPIFKIVATIYLIVMTVLYILGLLGSTIGVDSIVGMVFYVLFEVIGDYVWSMASGLGPIVVTFALLERYVPSPALDDTDDEEWDPRKLPPVKHPGRIDRADLVAESIVTLIVLLVANVIPERIGVPFSHDGEFAILPLLGEGYYTLLPLFNALWIGTIVLYVVVLRQGLWHRWSRIVEFAITVAWGLLLYTMLNSPDFFALNPDWLATATSAELEAASEVASFFILILRGITAVALIITVIEGGVQLYRLLTQWRQPNTPLLNLNLN